MPSPLLLFTDTETSGSEALGEEVISYKLPAHHPDQPRMASVTCILKDSETLKTYGTYFAYVKPNGWKMTKGATDANGPRVLGRPAGVSPIARGSPPDPPVPDDRWRSRPAMRRPRQGKKKDGASRHPCRTCLALSKYRRVPDAAAVLSCARS